MGTLKSQSHSRSGGGGGESSPAYSEGWSGSPDEGELDDDRHHEGVYEDSDSYGERSPSRRYPSEDAAKNFKVVIRVRPPLPREMNGDRPFQNTVRVDTTETSITVSENLAALDESGSMVGPYASHSFTFDHVYDQHCDQKKVYETTAKAVVESSLTGYNATIFAVRRNWHSSGHRHTRGGITFCCAIIRRGLSVNSLSWITIFLIF